ncbi:MAG: TonB-dependent copper receptor [Gammaproteobacteria bacterium]|nr:TonB-dependent copper receptor [Gammaproteobacteria bacterium]MBU1655854.1 TonB-dependent copper receptor [Gammaproteobacteria bacterium]MBU1960089.1 TonB-dependent copper receptor [Gammaproteobacteria bacterium]
MNHPNPTLEAQDMPHEVSRRTVLAAAIAALFSVSVQAQTSFDEIIVTAPLTDAPLTLVLDPKKPQQPIPANDGASFLKNIPGFSVIRKGGTDGDPVLRGLAGSRLNILVDGSEMLGGCGMRMDPPTAYIFPEMFDSVTVIKGPQTLRHGNGNLAGVVLFDRDKEKAGQPGVHGSASLTAGSWERKDAVAGVTAAGAKGFIQANASHAESEDYEDGGGNKVHSSYERQSLNLNAGWKIDQDTLLSIDATGSRAEADYADRTMDGVKFDREGYGAKFEKKNISPLVAKVEAQVYHNYIDHVMDNYSRRTKSVVNFMVNNPDRETDGGRLSTALNLSSTTQLDIGLDVKANTHSLRTVANASQAVADAYDTRPRIKDLEDETLGLWSELTHNLTDKARLKGGLRVDDWSADRYNSTTGAFVAGADETLPSGFMRYERDLDSQPAQVFIGLGHAERGMDHWEATTYNGLTATSQLDPEKNTQLDAGVIWSTDSLSASVSLFYSQIDDYILTQIVNRNLACSATNCLSSNVDATRYGGEADMAWRFADHWTLRGALSYVHADNDSMNVALAQTPPLEGRVGLDYSTGPWTFGGLVRMVDEQDRVHVGYGNVVGQDLGPTGGFTTLALNASYKPTEKTLISLGVDNVLDEQYAEHISRNGAAITDYTADTRVNEPGRTIWAKASIEF